MWNAIRSRWYYLVGVGSAAMLGLVGTASAAEPTYPIKPVTESITSELQSNLPVILGIIGGIIALTIAVRAIRKFVHV